MSRPSSMFSTGFLLLATTFITLSSFFTERTQADWWDDLKAAVGEKVDQGSEFAQNVAAPAIKDTWESAKTAVSDSDAHAWVKESALPAIGKGFSDVKSYIHEKTAPGTASSREDAEAEEREVDTDLNNSGAEEQWKN